MKYRQIGVLMDCILLQLVNAHLERIRNQEVHRLIGPLSKIRQLGIFLYLSHMLAAKAQTSQLINAVSSERSLFSHIHNRNRT